MRKAYVLIALLLLSFSNALPAELFAADGFLPQTLIIDGPASGCQNSTGTYTVSNSSATSGYVWSLPSGWTVLSGSGTKTISVRYSTAGMSQSLSVTLGGQNGSKSISVYTQPTGSPVINGPYGVCQGQTAVTYYFTGMGPATGYSWFATNGATITSSTTGSSITVNFPTPYSGGTIGTVVLNGACVSSSVTKTISVLSAAPSAAGTISGNPLVCPGSNGVTYSIPTITNATSYNWSVPSGATIVNGSNTNSITVNFSGSPSNGNVSVYGSNCLGNGASSTLNVNIVSLPGTPGVITGNSEACPGSSGAYSIPSISGATGYQWSVPAGATILSGQNTNTITVDFATGTTDGTISVYGKNCKGNGTSTSIPLKVNIKADAPNVSHSVDLVTGTLSAFVPLFNVTSGSLSVPVSLNYAASGVKVTDDDGWVGHNWEVSGSGYGIFRQSRSLPDDYSVTNPPGSPDPDNRKGWLFSTAKASIQTFSPTTDNNDATCSDEVSNYNYLNGISFDQDTEPDLFMVSAPGLALQFYFDESNVPRTVPYQDVIITPYTSAGAFTTSTTTGPITYFTVVDGNGITYEFRDVETLTEDAFEANDFYYVRKTHQHDKPFTYYSSWRLSKIISPIYGTINFTYKTVTIANNSDFVPYNYRGIDYRKANLYKYNFPLITSNVHGAGNTVAYQRTYLMKIITGITSSTTEAEFTSAPKSAGQVLERLSTIKLFDKSDGVKKLVKEIILGYTLTGTAQRAYLTSVMPKISCAQSTYTFEYNNDPGLPPYDSDDIDDFGFYKLKNPQPGSHQYDETAVAGTLRKINHPLKGYTVFFYETHDYWDGAANVQGGGIRIKKAITYDGESSDNDQVQEFIYKSTNGNSSGKLQHKGVRTFSVLRHQDHLNIISSIQNPWYYQLENGYQGQTTAWYNERFELTAENDISTPNLLHGSAVGYERVTVVTKEAGKTVYEYDLPTSYGETSANNNEWEASKVMIARPSSSTCYERKNISEGYNRYPFPVSSNYDFARALLKKTSDFDENGALVRDVVFEYQRIYAGTATRKIYGLALEQLPTYHTNGASFSKMFLYSRYALLTDVKTVLETQTETIYNSPDLVQKNVFVTNHYYESPNHRELTKTEVINSDGSTSAVKFKYAKDYLIGTPADAVTTALKALTTAHRFQVVETINERTENGTTQILGGTLNLFQTINGKVYPFQTLSYVSPDGTGGLVESTLLGSSTFDYDEVRYVVDQEYLAFDSFGNLTESINRTRTAGGTAYGYNGTVPVISVSNALLSEIEYSDFDITTSADFSIGWTPTLTTGRKSLNALSLPAGSATSNVLVSGLTNKGQSHYTLSFWSKASSAATVSIKIGASSSQTFSLSVPASVRWHYNTLRVPVGSVIGSATSFYANIWSSAAVVIDDIAFYPEQASIRSFTYKLPFGKVSETDGRGLTTYYEYNIAGRLKLVLDADGNIIRKFDYQVRP